MIEIMGKENHERLWKKNVKMETCSRNKLGGAVDEDFSDKIKENDVVWSERWI
jgi:hypothetical protein